MCPVRTGSETNNKKENKRSFGSHGGEEEKAGMRKGKGIGKEGVAPCPYDYYLRVFCGKARIWGGRTGKQRGRLKSLGKKTGGGERKK